MKLYHATDKKHLATILRDGILPSKSTSGQQAVYLTDQPVVAEQYCTNDCVIFEIEGSKLDEHAFGPDDFELQDAMDMGDLTEFSTWSDVPWEKSLETVHQVAYFETVLPAEIVRYKYKGRWQKPNFNSKVSANYIIATEITEEPVSIEVVKHLRVELAKAAQEVYDGWNQDKAEDLNGGGICHEIADAMVGVLHKHNVDAYQVSSNHEVHVYLVVKVEEGIFAVDIPYSIYETGGGYSWEKIEGVQFEPDDVVVDLLDHDSTNLKEYVDVE